MTAPGAVGAQSGAVTSEPLFGWPADCRDQWRAEEIIHRVFPVAVVIEEIEEKP